MKLKQTSCYQKFDTKGPEADYTITFIPSGFEGMWIKAWECYDYSIGIEYASTEENKVLNKKNGKEIVK